MIKIQAKHYQDWRGFLDVLWFQAVITFFQSEESSVQVSAVLKLTVSLQYLG